MPNFLNSKELNSAGFSRPQPASYELRSTLVERPLQIHPFYAKQSQFPKSQVFTKYYITRTYESWTLGQIGKTNPIQTQFKPNSNPIQTQSNPISTEPTRSASRSLCSAQRSASIQSDFVGAVNYYNFSIGLFGEPVIDNTLRLVRGKKMCSFEQLVRYL